MVNYAYTILYVESVEDSMQFYQAAFGFLEKFLTPEKDYGELISGDTTIAFARHDLASSNFKEKYQKVNSEELFGIELGFTTTSIETDFKQALTAGATLVEAVVEKPWGQKVGYVKDMNGFLIEICTPIKG